MQHIFFFTSGTTGIPKGVLGWHNGLSHFLNWQRQTFKVGVSDRVAQLIGLSFDAVLRDIFLPLTSGATLCLPEEWLDLSSESILPWLEQEQVSLIHTVPSLLQSWLVHVPVGVTLRTLKWIFIAGEPLKDKLVRQWRDAFPEAGELVNLYGSTETTLVKCYYRVPAEISPGVQPLGSSMPNSQALVLTENQQLCGISEPGEIVLRTPFRSLGYINASDENLQRFVKNPFCEDEYDQLYYTGDRGRYCPDGSLEILGRLDNQIKIRGIRIEPEEIEVTLSQHDVVKEAVVMSYKQEDNSFLSAYVTLAMPINDVANILRTWLKGRLPEYMIPTSFTVLEKLPLTPNGKIDSKALSSPDLSIQKEQQTPWNETEQLLCHLWSKVLGIEVVSVNSHFFEVGGHSLLATQLVSRIRESFGIEMPLRVVFEQALLKDQAKWLDKQQRGSELPPIVPLAEGESLVLSFSQQRLWFLTQLEGQTATYNISAAMHIEGELNEVALQLSLTALIQRHDSLRFCFPVVDGEATVQLNDVYDPLSITDLSELSENEHQAQVTKWISDHPETLFDLSTGHLLNLRLLKLNKQKQILLFNMHHIISDGWSIGVLIREWSHLYCAHAQNQEPKLPELTIQYTDYAAWQRDWLQGKILEQQLGYWMEKLTGIPALLELPTDYPRPAVMRYMGKHMQNTISWELTQGIRQISRQHDVTHFMTLLSAFKVLLYRYSGQTDLAIGSPIANRSQHQTEDLIGFFVNTLVLRTHINGEQTFIELLKQVRQTSLEAYSHQDIPFEYLVEHINPSRSLSHSPLFQVMFVLQNTPQEKLDFGDLKLSILEPENITAKFDLTLKVTEHEDQFICNWEYNTDLFLPDTVMRMTEHFQVLLEGIINNPEQTLFQLPLLTETEQVQLLEWNQAETKYHEDQTILDLFEEQVTKTPDNIAVVFEDQQLSYQELNRSANHLANYLLSLKDDADNRLLITDNCLVGICVERSLEMVIGLLGILKTGSAYVPLDPDYPVSRLQFMLEDSDVNVMLSQSYLLERLPVLVVKVICLDSEWEQIAGYSFENPIQHSDSQDLAYVIYTSGSTGKPKGCQVTHSNVTRLFTTTESLYNFNNQDVWTLFHSYAFDFSVWEIWGALLYGGKLVIVSYLTSRTPLKFYQLLIDQSVTILNQTPSAFKQLINVDNYPNELSLRLVISGGEALDFRMLQSWFVRHGDKRPKLVNMYGITETTVHVTHFSITKEQDNLNCLVGSPLPDLQVWLFDAHRQLVPIGVPGEMYVGGAGVTCGYLNHPELTAEKFVEIKIFGKRQRVYKTGDRARWLPDGNLEYLGRLDNQVKLRGFRIELSEIEVTLRQHESVKEAVVVLYNQEENLGLAAYITLNIQIDTVSRVLRSWLNISLPGYMIPASFTVLDELPLTPNGKIDRKALPVPDLSIHAEQQTPWTETEHLLCNLWSQVLGIEVTCIRSHFFEVGGHSLLATRLVSRIRESFDIEMPLREVFEHAHLKDQAKWLDKQQRGQELPPITPLAEEESLVLSFAQQRLWFLAQLEGQSATYNIPAALYIEGGLNEKALQRSLTTLIRRHDSLRLSFPLVDGKTTVQLNDIYNPLSVTDLSDLSESEQQSQVRKFIDDHSRTLFDLSTGPLLNLHLLKLGKQEEILLFNMHHIISDGWSIGVLIRDWSQLYSAYAKDQEPQLPELQIQYTDYAAWQRNWLRGETLDHQLGYWTKKLTGMPELLELPTDYSRPAVMSYQGKHLKCTLSDELTQGIKQLSLQHGTTVFMALLATFKVLLYRYSGQTDLAIGSSIANRTQPQTEDLIGFFVNTLVLRTNIKGDHSFLELLKQVRQTSFEAYSHQDIPFEYLVEQINPSRSMSHSPLFQVMFVLQNAPEEALELSGLKTSVMVPENTTAKFDLTLSVAERGDLFVCDWEYCTDLFRSDTVKRMTEHFRILLEGIINIPEQALSQLPLLTETEQLQLQNCNKTETNYSKDLTIVDLFEAQVKKTPDNIALVFENQQLSYRELNEKSNQVANYLISLKTDADNYTQVTYNSLVGICVERSLEMVIGLLGVLKAGGAYVPLDPDYPLSRLQFMLEDSNVDVLLSQSHLIERLPLSKSKVVCLDSQWQQFEACSGENPVRQSRPEKLAYVIYTSGSTGKPKGVMVEHLGLANLIHAQVQQFDIQSGSQILQFVSLSFDVATADIAMTLSQGATMYLLPKEFLVLGENLLSYLGLRKITHIQIPVSVLATLVPKKLPDLKVIIVGGDVCSSELVAKWSCGRKFINAYGPTESTVCATLSDCKDDGNLPSIGKPIANTKIYILDTNHNPTPPGIPGELCIAGIGLARGYLDRPELTAEKFIEIEIFDKRQRIYRTGDLARWLPDGNLEFLGRLDNQVKLRGVRIELGEIESILRKYESVKDTVVALYKEKDNPVLVAYVTLAMPIDNVSKVLRTWLKIHLPEYMLPASFTVLEKLPLTSNGKIDRKALPMPDLSIKSKQHSPLSETENLLCNLWSDILGVEVTSISSHFFEAGGHSLLATLLVSRIRKCFGVEMPLRVVFERSILWEQAEWIDTQQRGSELPPIKPLGDGESLVWSFAQQRLWFLTQLEGQSATYNMPSALHIEGKLNETALQDALTALIQRHDSLRLCFPLVEGEATVQLTAVYNPLCITDLSELSENEQQGQVRKWIANHSQTLFDLSTGPLLSLRLLKLGKQEQILLFNIHHIISDGWSMSVLIREWCQLYNDYIQNQQPQLSDLPIQYTDYAVWQRNWLEGEILEKQLDYWIKKLVGAPEMLEFPTDYPRPPVMRHQGKQIQSILDQELTQGIKQLSQQYSVTVFMTLLAAFKVLLFRYSGQTDIVVGSPIANRTHHQTEDLIGLFLNTLVLRSQIKGEQKFSELLKELRQTAIEAYSHQDIPFEYLIEQLNPSRSLSHSPLFQVMFVLQNAPEEAPELIGLKTSFLEPENTTVKFDLTLSITEHLGNVFLCDWKYNTDLFRPDTISRMTEHFKLLLKGILNNPEELISHLPLLTLAERQQLVTWNQTETDYPKDKTIVDLFEAQVEKTPDNIAIVFENQQLSYRELNWNANQLAHYLLSLKTDTNNDYRITNNCLVGVCMERSLEMVIGLLGILKAGGAYVPFDPDYPYERLRFMLEDSAVKVLLSQSHLLGRLPVSTAKVLCLDKEWEPIATGSGENTVRQSGPENLAYMIYTSGSTGVPKGAMNLHRGICNRLLWMQDAYQLTVADNVLQKTPFSFDVSVWEFFWPLLVGARLTIAKPGGHKEGDYLIKLIQDEQITTLHFVPSMLQVFLQEITLENCYSLKRVICSGEALPVELESRFFTRLPAVELNNLYGPTEAAVDVTYWACQKGNSLNILPIGRPIANTQIYILDVNHNPTPPGIPGELCIAGRGLARGYLNRVELTGEKFIEVMIFDKRQRIYKTGDMARWLPDGNLEFLGRLDNQVKLRGFRIELSEIEVTLSRHEAVKEAVVTLHNKEENASLAAYVTLAIPVDDVVVVLRTWLKARLPEYMLPASFTVLDKIPLAPNGKIDRKALPEPDTIRTGFIAPQTLVEQLIAGIWENLLGIDRIGIYDDFFSIGGNSLNGIRFINELNKKTGEIFHIYSLFEAPTIAKFVDFVKMHYPKLMAKMDDSYSLPEMERHGCLEKVNEVKLAQFQKLLPEHHFNNKINSDRNPPVVFIFAPPRSGTTLLRVILGGHPRLFAPPEMELLGFNTLKERFTRCMERDSFWLQGTIRALMEIKNCDVEQAKDLMTAYERKNLDIKQFYMVLQTSIGEKLLVDKTPFYALDINILKQAEKYFDNALYIHLVRHPCGMIHSFENTRLEQIISSHPYAFPLDLFSNSNSSTELAELLWFQCHKNILRFLETIPTSRQHRLKFEDLVNHPLSSVGKLCEFLELPSHPDMLLPYHDKKQRMTDGLYAEGNMLGDVKFHTYQQIDAKVAKKWKKAYIEDILGDMTWVLAEQLGYQRELGQRNIPRIPANKPLTISFAQQRLWILAQLEGQSATYNMPAVLHLGGKLNETTLQRSLTALIQRHNSLRLSFPEVNGEATVELNDVYNPLSVTDLSDLSENEQKSYVIKAIADHSQTQFDLSTGPLLSLHLLKLGKQNQILLFNIHHIISDGWSIGVMVREWCQLYSAYAQKQEPKLPELTIQYTDYAAWQRNWLQGEILEAQLGYWVEKLTGMPELLELPTDYPRPAVMRYKGKHLKSTLSLKLTHGIKQLSRQHGVTDFMTLLASFKVLLSRYSGQKDIAIGSPTANRTQHQTENLIGFFVNTLVLRTQINGEQTFTELLKQVRKTSLEAYSHQDIPFEYLVEQINPSRSLSHSPLFQVMFVLQNTSKEVPELTGLEMSMVEPENTTAKFDLTLIVAEHDGLFVCDWEYCTDLFRPDTVTRATEHFRVLLEGIINNPNQTISQLPLLTETEQDQLLVWNQTETPYPRKLTIVDLFEAQVEKTPDKIAVVFENQQLSYRELNEKSNQLANYLLSLKTDTNNCLVGICVERSLEMVIGLVGILKAGSAYVPLDPDYPLLRLQFMLEDSSVPVLLSQKHLLERLPASTANVVCLDSGWEEIANYSAENPVRRSRAENLAYVIYTSGSTGVPKGVMVTHKGFYNLSIFQKKLFDVKTESHIMQFASLSFDATCWELAMTIPHCAELHLSTADKLIPSKTLITLLKERRISHITLPPSALTVLPQESLPHLQFLVVAGETCSSELVAKWSGGQKFMNAYGPTESTVCATITKCQADSDLPSIGKPIANTQIYILDENNNPTPLGIPGELCIASRGLALGYLNRPQLTAEKFIEIEIFDKRQRIYKTGDLARWLPDGNLEFLGRMDTQVKLRGYRIELSEIEVTLIQHEAVKEAVVVIYNKGDNPSMPAYVTLAMPVEEIAGQLRTWLKTRLPEYMLPSSFTVLDKLPLTPNGKIDRKALPAPDTISTNKSYQPPRDTVELQLVQIWENVLDLRQISISDNFFDLGGHSLLAVRLMSQIEQQFKKQLPLTILFQNTTVEQLATVLRQQTKALPWSSLVAIQPKGERPPLFCVHPAGGNVLCYFELAQHLGKEQPFYGIQSFGLEYGQAPYTQVIDMAKFYLKEVQTHQPHGPYQLAGWSFGGLVAFEMARQLQTEDKDVSLVALLDAPAPSFTQEDQCSEDDAQLLVNLFAGEDIILSLEHLRQLTSDKQLHYVIEQGKKVDLFPPDVDIMQAQRLMQVYKTNVSTAKRYAPNFYSGKIILFQATERDEDISLEPDLGWRGYATEGVEIIQVPGSHQNMMRSPQIKILAEQLKIYLRDSK